MPRLVLRSLSGNARSTRPPGYPLEPLAVRLVAADVAEAETDTLLRFRLSADHDPGDVVLAKEDDVAIRWGRLRTDLDEDPRRLLLEYPWSEGSAVDRLNIDDADSALGRLRADLLREAPDPMPESIALEALGGHAAKLQGHGAGRRAERGATEDPSATGVRKGMRCRAAFPRRARRPEGHLGARGQAARFLGWSQAGRGRAERPPRRGV